jgi:cytoskeleton protein RodZ
MSADRQADFGTRLRQARERKGITLRDMANRTKISVAVLESLERTDVAKLPGGIFSRAFVKSYAKEVGLDPDVMVEEFIGLFPQDAATAGQPHSGQVEDTQLFDSDRRVASSLLWILVVSVPLAGGVLYLGMSQRASEPAAEHSAPPPKAAPAEPAPAVEVPAATGESTQPAKAVPQAAPSAAPPPTSASVPTAGEGLKIELSARRPVWVSATVDGQKAIGRLLQVGDKEVVDVKRELMLTAGDASAVRMTVNGVEARSLGKNGEVITARVTPANFKDYLQTR